MISPNRSAQALSVKRAQVEFHNFASLGEPDRALRVYAEENDRRGAILERHREFLGEMSPFLEIGANAGHTSYLVANRFEASGFALDISADALRHGRFLQDRWNLAKAPIRIAGDGLNLPFRDSSLRMVMTFQTLSQFLDLDAVFREVNRVLAPGGVFVFAEEPVKRMLSLRLFRTPYYDTMKPWERKLYDWGLLEFFVKDVIGAHQEESFGIRQNHRMGLNDWKRLIDTHFVDARYQVFLRRRGWAEDAVYQIARRLDRHGSEWVPARLLGGTLAAICRKGGAPQPAPAADEDFEKFLRCPDCGEGLSRTQEDTLVCESCSYQAPNEGGVYNLLRSEDRRELYPGDRDDLLDFSQSGHEAKLAGGWEPVEGVFGNKYRWIQKVARARLRRVRPGPQVLRIRGFAHENLLAQSQPARVEVRINSGPPVVTILERPGLFILEIPVGDGPDYLIEISAAPEWTAPPDERTFTVHLSLLRLVDPEG